MKRRIVLSAAASVFPGAKNTKEYWNNILMEKVAPKESISEHWGLSKESFYAPQTEGHFGIGIGKSYLDEGFFMPAIAEISSTTTKKTNNPNRQINYGTHVLNCLLADTKLSTNNCALILGTSWTDASYFNADYINANLKKAFIQKSFSFYDPTEQIEYFKKLLKITGPAIAVDTACASSLYAIANAIDLIQCRRVDTAIVLGLNGFLPPFLYVGFSKIQALSPTGNILPFSQKADGIVPGEGCGAIIIETEEHALLNKRVPLAILSNIGLSCDGGERSLFAPGMRGPQLAYERAYDSEKKNIDYIEAHGTATPLGDSTELSCLDSFFKRSGAIKSSIAIGSVKRLIGHTLASAGIASVIKAALMLKNRIIPAHNMLSPHNHFSATNANSSLYLPTKNIEVSKSNNDLPMRVGVNSLGFGGANCHLIMEEWQEKETKRFASNKKIHKSMTTYKSMEKIAIVASDFFNDSGLTNTDIKQIIAQKKEYVSPVSPISPTPLPKRDGLSSMNSENSMREEMISYGHYIKNFPEFNAKFVKMGPAQAKRLDPMLQLFANSIGRMVESNSILSKSSTDNGACVLCTNMGGNTIMRINRELSSSFISNISDLSNSLQKTTSTQKANDDSFSMETLLSCLPVMTSAIPAAANEIRGFHQLFSGSSNIVSSALILIPEWFKSRCEYLYLSAGTYIKSNCDEILRTKQSKSNYVTSISNEVINEVINGEGVFSVAFAKESLINKLKLVDKEQINVLGWIIDIIIDDVIHDNSSSITVDTIINKHNIDANNFSLIEYGKNIFTIDGRDFSSLFGSLAEASGIETLFCALNNHKKYNIIKFIEDNIYLVLENCSENSSSANSSNNNNCKTSTLETIDTFYKSCAQSVEALFNSRVAIAIALNKNKAKNNSKNINSNRKCKNVLKNVLIDNFCLLDKTDIINSSAVCNSAVCNSRLIVDDTHPYFFDHPLDHLPGILLLEGAIQTLQHYLFVTDINNKQGAGLYLSFIDIKFQKYAEKHLTTEIKVSSSLQVEIIQDGQKCCLLTAKFKKDEDYNKCQDYTNDIKVFAEKSVIRPNKELLHKKREENVLVSEIISISADSVMATALPLSPEQYFSDGHPNWHTPSYLLELARQCMMQMAHTTLKIPLDVPMNIFSVNIKINSPIERNASLSMIIKKESLVEINGIFIARISTTFFDEENKTIIGTVLIGSQMMDKDNYKRIRNTEYEILK
ncbi:MAG: hypothetical protein HQK51_15690 [Oligoflexia bacterium]|nr:hypothetical protein [Oligoflexia bacterium]